MEINVLHVLRTYLPVTENWLFHLLNNTDGIQHVVFCEKFSPGIFITNTFRFLPLPASYEPEFDHSYAGKLRRLIAKCLQLATGKTKQQYFSQLIKTEKPSIIHIHFGTMALVYESILLKTNLPFVVSFYGYDYNPKYRYKKIFAKASAIICEGKAGKAQLVALGCPEEKIKLVPLGIVPMDNIPVKTKPPGQLHLVQIASFTEKKGQIYSIQAFEKALAFCPDMTLTFLGPDSDYKKEIIAYINQNNLTKWIRVKEAISPDRLHEELQQYDVFIHPSITARDGDNEGGAPIVLLNAQHGGLPVISTFHKDIPDYIIHNQTGFLVPEKEVMQLAEAIAKFYSMDEKTYQFFSKNGLDHVKNHYSIIKNAVQLKNVYLSL